MPLALPVLSISERLLSCQDLTSFCGNLAVPLHIKDFDAPRYGCHHVPLWLWRANLRWNSHAYTIQ